MLKQLTLLTISVFLRPNVLTHRGFVTAHRTHPIPSRPKMQPRHSTFIEQFPVYSHCTFAFQKSYRIRHTVLWWNTQAQVDMVAYGMSLQQLDSFLFAQVPQNSAYGRSQLPIDHLPPVFRNEDYMILAFPSHMCQTLKILHTLSLLPNRAFPGVRAYAISVHAGTA